MTKKLIFGAALSALMLSGAFAQMPKSPIPNSTQPTATKSDQAKPAKAAQSKPSASQAEIILSQKPNQWLASNFKGTEVLGSGGKKIGDVSDILFDKTGKIQAYVISMGGFLGMGAKHVAIAPSSFTVVPGSNGKADMLKLSMNKNQLKQAQNFKPYQKPQPVTTGSATHSPLGGATPRATPMGGLGTPRH